MTDSLESLQTPFLSMSAPAGIGKQNREMSADINSNIRGQNSMERIHKQGQLQTKSHAIL
jgi:hypothetical protein